ncbi:MAG: PH domain-containing protein [Kocuria sp.]|nr:PH domain-containing protein [Kocuria sp.]
MTETPATLTPLRADDPATRPGSGDADGQWQGISSRYVWILWISEVMSAVILLAITGWPVALKLWVWDSTVSWWWVIPWPAMVLVFYVFHILLVPRRARAYCYREDPEYFLVRKGLIIRRLVVVPYGRMQYVDINSGPLLRAFGMAEITLHTASPETDTTLPGITAAEADRLRERLTERGEGRLMAL